MRRGLAGLAILVSLTLTGCGWEGTGTVTGKEFDEGEWEKYSCSKVVNGKSKTVHNGCTRWEGEEWEITVRDTEGKVHELDVDEDTFNRPNVGDTFDNRK